MYKDQVTGYNEDGEPLGLVWRVAVPLDDRIRDEDFVEHANILEQVTHIKNPSEAAIAEVKVSNN